MRALRSRPWAEALDFTGPRIRTAWWSWALLGLALLAGLALEHQLSAIEETSSATHAQLKRLARADHQQRLARAVAWRAASTEPRSSVSATTSRADSRAPTLQGPAMDEAAQLAQALAYPWPVVLQQLEAESARQQVVLMAMSLDTSSGQPPVLRALGAVPSDQAALGWAAALPQGQLLARQPLATPFEGRQDAYALKADIQAAWPVLPAGRP